MTRIRTRKRRVEVAETNARSSLQRTADKAGALARRMSNAHPLLLVAAGIAGGAVLGRLIGARPARWPRRGDTGAVPLLGHLIAALPALAPLLAARGVGAPVERDAPARGGASEPSP